MFILMKMVKGGVVVVEVKGAPCSEWFLGQYPLKVCNSVFSQA